MRILVCGGAGFIGTNFVRLVHDTTGHDVVNFDLLTYAGRRENLADLEADPRYRFVQGDVADPEKVREIVSGGGFDAVVNFAAETHVDRSIHDASAFLRTNVMGTQVLLDACRDAGVARFLQVSTDEVYGDIPPDSPPAREEDPMRPSSPYAASKGSADMLVMAAHRTHGQPVVVTRCSNNYGPYQFPEKFIPTVIHRAIGGQEVPIYGSGRNVRDWIHVDDHARGVLLALEHGRDGEVYNFGGGNQRRNIDVARAILDVMHLSGDLLSFVDDRPGHDFRYAIDHSKASRDLGWDPGMDFEDGLVGTVKWYLGASDFLEDQLSDEYRLFFEKHYGGLDG